MEDQRARFVSRATLSPSNTSGVNGARSTTGDRRSQWHGMDLHTNAPTSHRRAMYYGLQPKPQQSPTPRQMQPATTVVPSGVGNAAAASGSRVDADGTALTARNLMLRHRLAERKRYDSADDAMRRAMQALHSPGPASAESTPPSSASTAASSPRPSGSVSVGALQSPRVSARLGASVFVSALKSGQDEDVEMQDDEDNQKDADPMGYVAAIPASAKTSRYGQLGMSPSAAMSAANYLIQKKLHEKRHFDSADYQLALQGKQTDAAFDGMGAPALSPNALQLNQAPSPIKLNREMVAASPVNSPSASRAAAMRLAQMSPSAQPSAGPAKGGRPTAYGALGGAPSKNDLRRNVLLRQQETFISRQDPPAAPSTVVQAPQDLAAPNTRASKFGKLCAANVLLRRDLKERKYFDSADYEMECAAKQAPKQSRPGEPSGDNSASGPASPSFVEPSNQSSELNSPDMHPHAKHMKMSDGATNRWANHPRVTAAQEARAKANQQAQQLASKNVALTRLSERHQRFDSGDHFAAAAASHRRREAARGRLAS